LVLQLAAGAGRLLRVVTASAGGRLLRLGLGDAGDLPDRDHRALRLGLPGVRGDRRRAGRHGPGSAAAGAGDTQDRAVTRRELDAAGITDPALRACYTHSRRINARHGRTYFLATRLLAARQRPAVHALYGFARQADEIVDDLAATSGPEQRA